GKSASGHEPRRPLRNGAERSGGQVVRMRPGRRLGVPTEPVGFVGWGTPEHAYSRTAWSTNSLVDQPDPKAADQLSDKPHGIGHRYRWSEASSHDPKELAEHLS